MPLTFDIPIDELVHYGGTNPRPDDHDAFWAEALAELRTTEPQVTIETSAFGSSIASCDHLRFTGVGGARVYAKLLRPRVANGGVVVRFHGYSGNSGAWTDHLAFVAEGFTVLAMDCRGQGGNSEDVGRVAGTTLRGHIIRGIDDSPQQLYYRAVFLDAVQLARIALSLDGVDQQRLFVYGGSQGGALALACAALEPRVARAAVVYPFLSDYQRVWQMDLGDGAYEEIGQWFRRHDPTHERATEIFTRLGYIDVQHLAPRITAAVHMYTGLRDTTCPPSTQFAAYNRITSPKDVTFYPDYGHENLPGHLDHVHQWFRS